MVVFHLFFQSVSIVARFRGEVKGVCATSSTVTTSTASGQQVVEIFVKFGLLLVSQGAGETTSKLTAEFVVNSGGNNLAFSVAGEDVSFRVKVTTGADAGVLFHGFSLLVCLNYSASGPRPQPLHGTGNRTSRVRLTEPPQFRKIQQKGGLPAPVCYSNLDIFNRGVNLAGQLLDLVAHKLAKLELVSVSENGTKVRAA